MVVHHAIIQFSNAMYKRGKTEKHHPLEDHVVRCQREVVSRAKPLLSHHVAKCQICSLALQPKCGPGKGVTLGSSHSTLRPRTALPSVSVLQGAGANCFTLEQEVGAIILILPSNITSKLGATGVVCGVLYRAVELSRNTVPGKIPEIRCHSITVRKIGIVRHTATR